MRELINIKHKYSVEKKENRKSAIKYKAVGGQWAGLGSDKGKGSYAMDPTCQPFSYAWH